MTESKVEVMIDGGGTVNMGGGMSMDPGGGSSSDGELGEMGTSSETPFAPMESWPFIIGITGATLFISVVFGILIAKRKIKKGLDLYED